MAKTNETKAAEALIEGCARYDWNPWLFIGTIMLAPPHIQGVIIDTLVKLFQDHQTYAENPHLQNRVSQQGYDAINSVDLTEFDR